MESKKNPASNDFLVVVEALGRKEFVVSFEVVLSNSEIQKEQDDSEHLV
jgi:hypothetical protein